VITAAKGRIPPMAVVQVSPLQSKPTDLNPGAGTKTSTMLGVVVSEGLDFQSEFVRRRLDADMFQPSNRRIGVVKPKSSVCFQWCQKVLTFFVPCPVQLGIVC